MWRLNRLLAAVFVTFVLSAAQTVYASVVTPLSTFTSSGAPVASGTAEQDLQKKRKIFKDSVVKLWQDYRLNAAYVGDGGWIDSYGKDPTKWPPNIKQELVRRDRQKNSSSYIERNTVPQNPDDDDVEIAAADVRKDIVWGVLAPALVRIGELVTLVGEDAKGLGVELVKTVLTAEGVHEIVTEDNAQALIEKYAPDFGKLSFGKQLEVIGSLLYKFNADVAIEKSRLKPPNVGGQAGSGGPSANIAFDAGTGILTVSGDTITDVDGGNADAAVGANVNMPQFQFAGLTSWGDPQLLFTAIDTPSGTIEGNTPASSVGGLQFLTEFPSLVYFPEENAFEGIMPYGVDVFANSPFLDGLGASWESDSPLFATITLEPLENFSLLTNNFEKSASSSFVNIIAVSQVPEPPTLILLVAALGLLVSIARAGWQARLWD